MLLLLLSHFKGQGMFQICTDISKNVNEVTTLMAPGNTPYHISTSGQHMQQTANNQLAGGALHIGSLVLLPLYTITTTVGSNTSLPVPYFSLVLITLCMLWDIGRHWEELLSY